MCFGFAGPATAQVTLPEEYSKTVKSAEAVGAPGPNLFGDDTSLYTGAITFSATDVSLRGNNALPVAVGRRFSVQSRDASERSALLTRDGGFADWELDIPHLHGVFAKNKGWQVDGWGLNYLTWRPGFNQYNHLLQMKMIELWGAEQK